MKTPESRRSQLQALRQFLDSIGLTDLPPETLERHLDFWDEFLGDREAEFEPTVFPHPNKGGGELSIGPISFVSLCEHHLLPFAGVVEIMYTPEAYILGLSKFVRIVRKAASRPQTQEGLTFAIAQDIAATVSHGYPSATSVEVRTEATHLCMVARGVREANVRTSFGVRIGGKS